MIAASGLSLSCFSLVASRPRFIPLVSFSAGCPLSEAWAVPHHQGQRREVDASRRLDLGSTTSRGPYRTFAEPHFPVKTRTRRPLCAATIRVAAAVCSRAANAGFCRSDRRHAIAVSGCQQAARRWRRWQATQRYRASDHGKERRRDQSRRYRHRTRQRSVAEPVAALAATPLVGEGQRPAEFSAKNAGQPCQRPGCYDCFAPSPRSPQQRFCSSSCRQALRRVRQREDRMPPTTAAWRAAPSVPWAATAVKPPATSSRIARASPCATILPRPQTQREERVGR